MDRSANPRYLAVVTLNKLEESEAFLKEIADSELQKGSLKRVDQGLYTELVYGTVRMRRNLDHVLSQFSSRPLAKIEPALLNILRIGVYQLFYLTKSLLRQQ